MSAKIIDLEQFRAMRERRLMLEAMAEHDLVLASLLLQNDPFLLLSSALWERPEAESEPRRPQPPSE